MLTLNGTQIAIDHFPDKTLLFKSLTTTGDTIEWHFENNEELIALYFIVNHLKDKSKAPLHLVMKYIPNARQDRTKAETDVFTLKHFAKLINSLGFDSVSVLDPHSHVALSLIERITELPVKPYIQEAIRVCGIDQHKDILFYPDEGSQKRYSNIIDFPHGYGQKKRNWEDGRIIGLDVIGELPVAPFNVLIVDDICSFGGTFLHAAKKLKTLGADKIYLYVTHCENSIMAGELIQSGLLEHIYTTNSLLTETSPLITILE